MDELFQRFLTLGEENATHGEPIGLPQPTVMPNEAVAPPSAHVNSFFSVASKNELSLQHQQAP